MPSYTLEMLVKAIDQASGPLRGVGTSLGDLSKHAETGGQKVEGISDKIAGLKAQILPAVGILAGFGFAVKQAFDFGEQGAQIMRLEAANESLAENYGTTSQRIVSALTAASLGTVSNTQIILAANRAMMLGIGGDVDKLSSLMEVAAFRGRAMGLSTTQAFNDIVTGVGRMSPMILDNLGIVVDAERRYREWAAATGRAADSLSAAEKRQILLNSVVEEGNKQIEAAGGMALDAAGKYERLDASWDNFIDSVKVGVAGPLTNAVEALDLILFWSQHMQTVLAEHGGTVLKTSDSYAAYSAELVRAAGAAGYVVDAHGDMVQSYTVLDEYSGEVIYHTEKLIQDNYLLSESAFYAADGLDRYAAASWDSEDAARMEADAIREAAQATGDMIGAAEIATNPLYDLATAAGTVAAKFGEMEFDNDALWNLALATGKSVEELALLAEHLGIATESEIQNTLGAYQLIEAWEAGIITESELRIGFQNLQEAQDDATLATARAIAKNDEMQNALRGSKSQADNARAAFIALKTNMDAIPRIVRTDVITTYYTRHEQGVGGPGGYQHGTPAAAPGWAWVGERGPEPVYFGGGERVIPAGYGMPTEGGRGMVVLAPIIVQDSAIRDATGALNYELLAELIPQ